MNGTEIPKINVPFSFTRKPRSIPPDLRTDWRIAVLLLILYYSRSHKASLKKVNVINWAIRSTENRNLLLEYLLNKIHPNDLFIRFEPGIIRAIDFAKGYELIKVEDGESIKLTLTDKGTKIAKKIDSFDNCFVIEREFLRKIGPHALEKNINALLNWEISQ